jgi:hypothetical protein
MFKRSLLTAFILSTAIAAAPAQSFLTEHDIGESDYTAPPRLIKPSTDVVDLSGKDCLEFSWSPHEGDQVKREYYDLRLYRGRQAYGQYRIYMVRIPPRQWSVCIESGMFEDGAYYTLALRQVYRGFKSKRTFQTFRVMKPSGL